MAEHPEEYSGASLESKIFETLGKLSLKQSFFLYHMRSRELRWSEHAMDSFALPASCRSCSLDAFLPLVHPDNRDEFAAELERLSRGETDSFAIDCGIRMHAGHYAACTCKFRRVEGEKELLAGTILHHGIVDTVDAVTGLDNLSQFSVDLDALLHEGVRAAVLLVGIRHFTNINAVYGYSRGNELLVGFAKDICRLVGQRGKVYRMDGVKFAVILRDAALEEISELYNRLTDCCLGRDFSDSRSIPLTLAAGAAMLEGFRGCEQTVRSCVGYALQESKQKKGGALSIFSDNLHEAKMSMLRMLDEIRRDVLSGCRGFFLCYQPLIEAKTQRIIGMEALLRWKGENTDVVPPNAFIPWLEPDPCYYTLGAWIIRRALADAAAICAREKDFIVNINIAHSQLNHPDFRSFMLRAVREAGVRTQNVCLELTERCRCFEVGFIRQEVTFFRAQGFHVALDDFGTGMSSLNLLREVPVDEIKIDGTFVTEIETNDIDRTIVQMVCQCAARLDVSVCVEGIENTGICDTIEQYDANIHQGYFFSRPVPIERFIKLMETNKAAS